MENGKVVSCDNCGRQVASSVYLVNIDGRNLCDQCAKDKRTLESPDKQQLCSESSLVEPTIGPLEEKYSVLRFLNGFYKLIAVLVAIVAIFLHQLRKELNPSLL